MGLPLALLGVIKGVFGFAAQVFFYANEFAVLKIADVGGCAAAVYALSELGVADFVIQLGGVGVGEIPCRRNSVCRRWAFQAA